LKHNVRHDYAGAMEVSMREGGVIGDATDSGKISKRSSSTRMETAQAQSEEKRGDVHMQHSELRRTCSEEAGCIYLCMQELTNYLG
jgi:hypothetical protein